MMTNMSIDPILVRVLLRSEPGQGGCWIWQGAKSPDGHGRIGVGKGSKLQYVHRVVYEILVGPIPSGLVLDHLCRVRACCNPAHLEPVTQAVNLDRAPDALATKNKAKTHCPHGHPYDFLNTYYNKRGGRSCRACATIRARIKAAAQRGAH